MIKFVKSTQSIADSGVVLNRWIIIVFSKYT